MTSTAHPVTRKTCDEWPVLWPKPKKIVVTIGPGDYLTFRHLRCRFPVSIEIAQAFLYAVRRTVLGGDRNKPRRCRKQTKRP